MPLPAPNLDDRTFDQLVEESRRRIRELCPEWTDLSPGDPGMVLLELFAYLTETMIYRLNRVPEKAYVEFLRLMGVRLHPPTAAAVELRFTRRAGDQPIEIPRGTRVALNRADGAGEPPVFVTAESATIPSGQAHADVPAHHCELVMAERVGVSTGVAGLAVAVQRPPIVAPTGYELDLVVGVEARPEELGEREPTILHEGTAYRVWREVDSFIGLESGDRVYVVDRMSGTITFAPAAQTETEDGRLEQRRRVLAAVPEEGREIRVWYRRGGGPEGNVAANTLTTLKDPIAGVEVSNPSPATGGQAAETLDNALIRGPQELHALQRAVTARDFELFALSHVARARAFTQKALWVHAREGTVQVVTVPRLPQELAGAPVTVDVLRQHESEAVRSLVQRSLDERRPLGTRCLVSWARYKPVSVNARIVVYREEDAAAVKQRVLDRLHRTINPLPTEFNSAGWGFGQSLHASHVYDIALAEPGVNWVDRVKLIVDQVPDGDVSIVASDAFEDRTWYVGSGPVLFRSLNDGRGWEPAGIFADDERVYLVEVHPEQPGLVAATTRLPESRSVVHVSGDCGETWQTAAETAFEIKDMAWLTRDGQAILLLATDAGLFELAHEPGASPVQVLVDPQDPNRAFYAVVATRERGQTLSVAAAAQTTGGVYLSNDGGRGRTYRLIGLRGEDIRVLAVQQDGVRRFLWAGAAAAGGEGKGCFRWELLGVEDPQDRWQARNKGWRGGSCFAVAFRGMLVLAASHNAGVLRLDAASGDPQWEASTPESGLPIRGGPQRLFFPVSSVAVGPRRGQVMAAVAEGTMTGIFRSPDGGRFEYVSGREFTEEVTTPQTWLVCSAEHSISVESEGEAQRD